MIRDVCPKCGKPMKRTYYTDDICGIPTTVEDYVNCEHCGYWREYVYGHIAGSDYPNSPETYSWYNNDDVNETDCSLPF